MTGLETGERLQRALEKEGESVTLAKKSRYLPPAGSQCAVSHLTLPEKRRIRLCW